MKRALEAPLQLPASRLDLRVSVGVAMAPQDGESAETLLRNADNALLEVKRQDPGDMRFYNAEMKALAEEYLMLRGNLRRAITQGEIHLEYQPQVELIGGKVAGLEALARWRTPEGVLDPAHQVHPYRRGQRRHPDARQLGAGSRLHARR